MINLLNQIKNLIKKPYYYVPPCPFCGSERTGRYIKSHLTNDSEWIFRESLKNGELVIEVPEVTRNNAFCIDCQFSWPQYIETRYLSLSEIQMESEKRGTRAVFIEETEKMKERRKKENIFKRFIGNI